MAATMAASQPLMPPPATTIFLTCPALSFGECVVSLPAKGFTRQVSVFFFNVLPRHPWQHPMQVSMDCVSPDCSLRGRSGSATDARPMATRSALPDRMTSSASCGLLILPTVATGMPTTFLISLASSTNAPFGT